MYNNYHHGQPVPSLPLPQQQSLYFITPVHHNYHSLPPPPRFFVPSQVVMQQYHDSYEEKRSRKTLHSHDMNRNRSSSDKRRTLSDTTTLNGTTTPIKSCDNSPQIMTNRSKHGIMRSMKLSADWIIKTFCFCFTDDDIAIK